MLSAIRTLRNLLCILGGLAVVGYGAACLLGVHDIILSKYTPGARDSIGTPVLLILLGGVALLYGAFDFGVSGGEDRGHGRDKT